jgi:bromodomain-containing protein 9
MPRSPSLSPSPSPERHPPLRRRGTGASRMQLNNHHHHRRRSPSPPARRSLRQRRAAAASSRPLVDDFFPFPSSPSSSLSRLHQRRPSPEPSSSDSGDAAGASSASDRRRRKLKLVVKLSQLPPGQQRRRVPPPPRYLDDSDGEEETREDGSGDEDQVKPPKKCRIEPRGDRSRHREVGHLAGLPVNLVPASPCSCLLTSDLLIVQVNGARSDAASAPRTKRLPVPGSMCLLFARSLLAQRCDFERFFRWKIYSFFRIRFRDLADDSAARPECAGDDSRQAAEVRTSHLVMKTRKDICCFNI